MGKEDLGFSLCDLIASIFFSSSDESEDREVRHHSVYGRLIMYGYQPKISEVRKKHPTPPKVSSAVYRHSNCEHCIKEQ